MAWCKTTSRCPKCGSCLVKDTSTGDYVCQNCDYESGYNETNSSSSSEDK